MKTKITFMLFVIASFATANFASNSKHKFNSANSKVTELALATEETGDDTLKSSCKVKSSCGKVQTSCYMTSENGKGEISCKQTDLSKLIDKNFRSWDFSKLNSTNTAARVSFVIDNNGLIILQSIDAENDNFRNLVLEHISNIKVDSCQYEYEPGVIYNITLKYKKI